MATEQLPGMKDKKSKKLDELIERYVKIRDKRMALTPEEVAARQALEQGMTSAGKKTYRHSEGMMYAKLEGGDVKAKVVKIDPDESVEED